MNRNRVYRYKNGKPYGEPRDFPTDDTAYYFAHRFATASDDHIAHIYIGADMYTVRPSDACDVAGFRRYLAELHSLRAA